MRTAESVSPMHPDKLCDRISDAVLDACLEQDKDSRVAIETMGGHGIVTITGELTTNANVDIREVAKSIVGDKYGIQVNVVQQSPEIANGVDTGGAGDQGIMIGYATKETPEGLPVEVVLSRNLNRFIYEQYPYDGKTQVTLNDNNSIVSIVASFQNVSKEDLHCTVSEWLDTLDENLYMPTIKELKMLINPAGDWSIGGFEADTGLTGRKLAIDNYGPSIPLGGGCFSGKDPSKVDRSAAYMARRIACDILHDNSVDEVYVRLAYAIGFDQPVEATFTHKMYDGTTKSFDLFKSQYKDDYDLSPNGIIRHLDLKRPIYGKTAEYGHFGNGFDWDK